MRLTLIGMQASGKGTLGREFSNRWSVPLISIGDLMRVRRQLGDELAARIASYMDRGALVPDEIVAQALAEELGRPEASSGFVLDGYPRRADQGATLDTMLRALPNPATLDCAIYLELDAETARARLANRLTCSDCGRPDRKPLISRGDWCPSDGCTGRMEERDDDLNEKTVERRIETFFEETFPLVDYYEARDLLFQVDARQASDIVLAEVDAELERRRR